MDTFQGVQIIQNAGIQLIYNNARIDNSTYNKLAAQ